MASPECSPDIVVKRGWQLAADAIWVLQQVEHLDRQEGPQVDFAACQHGAIYMLSLPGLGTCFLAAAADMGRSLQLSA